MDLNTVIRKIQKNYNKASPEKKNAMVVQLAIVANLPKADARLLLEKYKKE